VAQHANDLPTLMREGCAHMVRVCVNEYQLYQHFFSTVHEGLDELLDHLTRVLYDEVRPLILRRNVSGGGSRLMARKAYPWCASALHFNVQPFLLSSEGQARYARGAVRCAQCGGTGR
jgi:hypothetical protein